MALLMLILRKSAFERIVWCIRIGFRDEFEGSLGWYIQLCLAGQKKQFDGGALFRNAFVSISNVHLRILSDWSSERRFRGMQF